MRHIYFEIAFLSEVEIIFHLLRNLISLQSSSLIRIKVLLFISKTIDGR
jgi:hypothetical protein